MELNINLIRWIICIFRICVQTHTHNSLKLLKINKNVTIVFALDSGVMDDFKNFCFAYSKFFIT